MSNFFADPGTSFVLTTNLDGAVNNSQTSITVINASNFPSKGKILIESELIANSLPTSFNSFLSSAVIYPSVSKFLTSVSKSARMKKFCGNKGRAKSQNIKSFWEPIPPSVKIWS